MRELIQQVDRIERKLDKLAVLEGGGGGGGVTSVTGTAPIASSGGTTPAISIAITPANPGGAVALQGSTPGTQQTGNANLSGKLITGGDVAASGNVSGVNVTGSGTVQGATVNGTSKFQLNSVTILEEGTSFPGSPVNLQRYKHDTYRSWFTYYSADTKWRQESPGVFSGSFPTVSSGDNTAAPNIEVKRIDQNNTIYFWNGANWLTLQNYLIELVAVPGKVPTNQVTAATTSVLFSNHPDGISDVYLLSISASAFINTNNSGNNGTNYWTTTFRFRTAAGGTGASYTSNTSAGTGGNIISLNISNINTNITKANFFDVYEDFAKVGTPGDLFFNPAFALLKLIG